MSWTSSRIEKLKKLWEKGLSTSEIGVKLGFSKNAVVGKAHRLGLKSRLSNTKKIKRKITKPTATKDTATKTAAAEKPKETGSKPKKEAKSKINSKIVSILNLKTGMCRWPMGDPRLDNFSFCGEETFGKKPYCLTHCSIAYAVSNKDKDKEKKTDDSQGKKE